MVLSHFLFMELIPIGIVLGRLVGRSRRKRSGAEPAFRSGASFVVRVLRVNALANLRSTSAQSIRDVTSQENQRLLLPRARAESRRAAADGSVWSFINRTTWSFKGLSAHSCSVSQSSIARPSTRSNSRPLFVTTVQPSDLA